MGSVVAIPKLPPARGWLEMADELDVRGGNMGRVWGCC